MVDVLLRYSRYPVPHALLVDVAETMSRYGRLQLLKHPVHGLVLSALDVPVLEEVGDDARGEEIPMFRQWFLDLWRHNKSHWGPPPA